MTTVRQPNTAQWPAFKSNAQRRGFTDVQLFEGRVWWNNGQGGLQPVQASADSIRIILRAVKKGYK